jgi:hypothetical protein
LSSQGFGAALAELTSECVPFKRDFYGTPFIEIVGYSTEVNGATELKPMYLGESCGIFKANDVYVNSIPRTVVRHSEMRYTNSFNTMVSILKSLKCFTKEEGLAKLGNLCPITYPIVPVLMEIIRSGTDVEFNTSNSAAIHRSFLKVITPAINLAKAKSYKTAEVDFKPEYLPRGITKKDTRDFVDSFMKTKYHGVPIKMLIQTGAEDTIIEASEKHFEVFLRNGEKEEVVKKAKEGQANLGELLKKKMASGTSTRPAETIFTAPNVSSYASEWVRMSTAFPASTLNANDIVRIAGI